MCEHNALIIYVFFSFTSQINRMVVLVLIFCTRVAAVSRRSTHQIECLSQTELCCAHRLSPLRFLFSLLALSGLCRPLLVFLVSLFRMFIGGVSVM